MRSPFCCSALKRRWPETDLPDLKWVPTAETDRARTLDKECGSLAVDVEEVDWPKQVGQTFRLPRSELKTKAKERLGVLISLGFNHKGSERKI